MDKKGREELGRRGEDLACQFLENKGHTILERNLRIGHLEIDIVSLDPNGIHFVEVKTRRAPVQLEPEACVTLPKQRKLVKAAALWLKKNPDPALAGQECSFDIIGVLIEDGNHEIRYMEQAFIPIYM